MHVIMEMWIVAINNNENEFKRNYVKFYQSAFNLWPSCIKCDWAYFIHFFCRMQSDFTWFYFLFFCKIPAKNKLYRTANDFQSAYIASIRILFETCSVSIFNTMKQVFAFIELINRGHSTRLKHLQVPKPKKVPFNYIYNLFIWLFTSFLFGFRHRT